MNFVNHSLIYIHKAVVGFWIQKLNTFYRGSIILLAFLWLVRVIFPSVLDGVKNPDTDSSGQYQEVYADNAHTAPVESIEAIESIEPIEHIEPKEDDGDEELVSVSAHEYTGGTVFGSPNQRSLHVDGKWHKVRGVASYDIFADLQDTQLPAAQKWGIVPAKNRDEAEAKKHNLVYVGGSPYYHIDEAMSSSMPYLVPRASELLNRIGRNFFDSLYVKHLPLHKIIVSSVWRTEADVASLSSFNPNATKQSCHLYATTIDISYVRFQQLPAPKGRRQRVIGDDILKYVLCEVLRDLRDEGACYVKHEVKMPCFHITVR